MAPPAIVLAVLLVAGPPCAPPQPPPDTVLDWLARAPVRSAFEHLLQRARYGLASYESAAWIVRGRDGDVGLKEWAFSGSAERIAWRGPVPDGALAIVHTHPRQSDPRPSSADAALARRLGLPVYALSSRGFWVARADGRILLEAPAPRDCARIVCLP
jgi:hypothetical protein